MKFVFDTQKIYTIEDVVNDVLRIHLYRIDRGTKIDLITGGIYVCD